MQGHHLYASSNWARDKQQAPVGPGEVMGATKRFLTGRNPPCYLGQCRVGSDEAWQNGLSVKVLDEPPEDLPECCSILPCPFVGLSLLGATTFLYYNVAPPPPASFSFPVSGLFNNVCTECAALNQIWTIAPWAGHPHEWVSGNTTLCGFTDKHWHLWRDSLDVWRLQLGSAAINRTYSVSGAGAWDEHSTLTLADAGGDLSCLGWPATITLTPL